MRISDWSSDVCSSDLEYLVDLRKVPRRRRLVAPQREQVGKPLRHMRRVALRAPIGLVAAAQRIVELQKLDDTIPAIAEQRVEALGMDRHRGAARREILGQRAQRQLEQHDRDRKRTRLNSSP